MFNGCYMLNQNIQIPANVTTCEYMFNNCSSLNQNIQIPDNAKSCAYMFHGCYNLNQNIQIPPNVTSCVYMFGDCNRITNVTILPYTVTRTFTNCFPSNSSSRLNIWTDNETAQKLKTIRYLKDKVSSISYTESDNCYYNAQYNLYIYTNAVFA